MAAASSLLAQTAMPAPGSQMTMFDGLPHAFWLNLNLHESLEAYAIMADFFNRQLGQAPER